MKKYKFTIPVYWTMNNEMEVEAENLKEAIHIAKNMAVPEEDAEYCDGSFQVCDMEVLGEVNEHILEIIKIDAIPKKDLPLWVNTIWKTNEGQEYFEKRLKEK